MSKNIGCSQGKSSMIEVAVFNDRQHEQFTSDTGCFVLRQAEAVPKIWTFAEGSQLSEPANGIQFKVTQNEVVINTTQTNSIVQSIDGHAISCGEALPLPCVLQIDNSWLEIAQSEVSRQLVPLLPAEQIEFNESQSIDADQWNGPSSETITRWLSAVSKLHRSAANSPQFYADAARFAVETIGLDAAWVLTRSEEECRSTCHKKCYEPWKIVGSCLTKPTDGVRFDSLALRHLEKLSVTWYQPTPDEDVSEQSLNILYPIVTAPILDSTGNLVAAIYGVRTIQNNNRRRGIRPLEARLIQLLAESVGVGIARLEQETQAARARMLLERAFSPTVVDYIQQHPESLSGQQREITLLFADICGYTAIAETLSPAVCYDLLGDVMELLTEVVMQNNGVVVDYYGDGLLAIWNAPVDQSNHADLACASAIQMFDQLPNVTNKWEALLGRPLEISIGVHTGPAYVGNAGTRSQIKYGPRGNTVNVASRVQAASKQLELPLVITAETQRKLSDNFFTLRTCTARLPGLAQPTELFTAYPASRADRVRARLDQYAQALQLFEAGELVAAEQMLSQLISFGQVTPARFLAKYTSAKKNGQQGRRAVDRYADDANQVIEILGK